MFNRQWLQQIWSKVSGIHLKVFFLANADKKFPQLYNRSNHDYRKKNLSMISNQFSFVYWLINSNLANRRRTYSLEDSKLHQKCDDGTLKKSRKFSTWPWCARGSVGGLVFWFLGTDMLWHVATCYWTRMCLFKSHIVQNQVPRTPRHDHQITNQATCFH